MSNLPFSAAAERNKQPIRDSLAKLLPPQGTALEIASGTGQHVTWLAAGMPAWNWQPSDADAAALPALDEAIAAAALPNVLRPLRLDVMSPTWPDEQNAFRRPFEAIFCANMLHIAPWDACAALMRGSARHLAADGLLVTYGPYLEDAVATAPGNLAFDRSLRERNAAWGIRRLEDVCDEAARAGLVLRDRYQMPANNLLLVFRRRPS
jgi:hypothetical protein